MTHHSSTSAAVGSQRQAAGWVYPLVLLVTGGTLLGLSTNLAKLAGEAGIPPLGFLAWSIAGAAVALLVIAAVRGALPPLRGRVLLYLAVAAFVTVAASNLIFFSAVPHVGAGFVALAIAFPPLLTYAGALTLGMERFHWGRAIGVAAALCGAIILALYKLGGGNTSAFWVALTFLGPVLLAIGNIYRTRAWPQGLEPEALAPGMLAVAVPMLFAVGLLPGFSLAVPFDSWWPPALVLIQAAVFAGQFLILFELQKAGGPVVLSLLGSVGSIVGVPFAVLALGEDWPGGLLFAAPLIALGVWLVAREGNAKDGDPTRKDGHG